MKVSTSKSATSPSCKTLAAIIHNLNSPLKLDNTANLLNSLKESMDKLGKLASAIKSWNLPNWTFEETYDIVAKHGWYLPPFAELKLAFSIMKLYEAENIVEAESTMVKYFKKNIKEIESELITLHPAKAAILKEAFTAHKRKMYYSSTILFLAQADGICDTIIFSGRKLKNIKNKKEAHPIVKILSVDNPLTDHYDPKTKNSNYFSELNRHGVIHGVSNEYGNELNSLKALSLVCFVSDFARYSR